MHTLEHVPRVASLGAGDERYQVHGALEIVSLLRKLIAHRSLVTAHASEHGTFIVTTLLAIVDDNQSLILDYGADREQTEHLLARPRLVIVTQLDHVRIQFAIEDARSIEFEGAPAFRVPMPDAVTRLQRREHYRLRLPRGRPLACAMSLPFLPADTTHHPAPVMKRTELGVYDLSCGGLALTGWPDDFVPRVGLELPDASIELPDLGRIRTTLRIIHVQGPSGRGNDRGRFGCKFLDAAASAVNLVQRHINRVEREQRALM